MTARIGVSFCIWLLLCCNVCDSFTLPSNQIRIKTRVRSSIHSTQYFASTRPTNLWTGLKKFSESKNRIIGNYGVKDVHSGALNVLKRLVLGVVAISFGMPVKAALAVALSNAVPKPQGWDIYGRVPYDDALFTTAALTEPNLLRRSIVEEVLTEIPDVRDNFKRVKILEGAQKGCVNVVIFLVSFGMIGLLISTGRNQIKKNFQREEALMGVAVPISATYKRRKEAEDSGREIGSMDGWVDKGGYGSDYYTDEDDDVDNDDDDDE